MELGNATFYNCANHLEECIQNAEEGRYKFLNPLFVLHYLKESEFNSNTKPATNRPTIIAKKITISHQQHHTSKETLKK